MTMQPPRRARALAGAFLLCALAAAARGERLRIAAERPDASCPADAKLPGVARLTEPRPADAPSACIFVVKLDTLSDADIDAAVARLASVRGAPGSGPARFPLPTTSSASPTRSNASLRSSARARPRVRSPSTPIGRRMPRSRRTSPRTSTPSSSRPGRAAPAETALRSWVLVQPSASASPTVATLSAFVDVPQSVLVADVAGERPLTRRRHRHADAARGLPDGRCLARSHADAHPAQGRLVGRGPAALRRQEVHADPAPPGGSRRRGFDRAVGRALCDGVGRKPRLRREAGLRPEGRAVADARSRAGAARRGPAADGEEGRRDEGRRRGRRDARPDGRGDRRPREGLGRRAAGEDEELHRADGYVPALPRGVASGKPRPDDPGPVLLPAGQAAGLDLAGVLLERRQVEREDDPEAPDPAARQGHDPSPRHPPVRGIRLRRSSESPRSTAARPTAWTSGPRRRSATSRSTAARRGSTARPSRSCAASRSS